MVRACLVSESYPHESVSIAKPRRNPLCSLVPSVVKSLTK
jgi:hypothetical protein